MTKRIVAEEEKSKLLLEFMTWVKQVKKLDLCEWCRDDDNYHWEPTYEEAPQLIEQFLSKK